MQRYFAPYLCAVVFYQRWRCWRCISSSHWTSRRGGCTLLCLIWRAAWLREELTSSPVDTRIPHGKRVIVWKPTNKLWTSFCWCAGVARSQHISHPYFISDGELSIRWYNMIFHYGPNTNTHNLQQCFSYFLKLLDIVSWKWYWRSVASLR